MQPAVLSFHAIKNIHCVLIDLRSLLRFDRKVMAIDRPFTRPPSAPVEPHAVRLSERDMCIRCGLTGLGQQLNCNGALPIATWSTGHNGSAGLGLLSSRKPLCIWERPRVKIDELDRTWDALSHAHTCMRSQTSYTASVQPTEFW